MHSFLVAWVEVITDVTRREELIQGYHCSIPGAVSMTASNTGGHVGQNKTTAKLSASFYWPNIATDVKDFVEHCDKCQRVNNVKLQKSNEELHTIPVPIKAMSQIGIDLMKLKESNGYNYVISAVDYFTKYVEMGALKDKKASTVSLWIYDNIFCRYGVTDIHITDNGTEFVNAVSKSLYERCNVAHRVTSPYHPAANGLVE